MKLKISDFASEFFVFYRGLAHELRTEVSERLRKMNIGRQSLEELLNLLVEKKATTNGPMPEKVFLEIQLTGASDLKKDWEKRKKNLLLVHLELLCITCRMDTNYTYDLFHGFERLEELVEGLLDYPDDSKFQMHNLIFFRRLRSLHGAAQAARRSVRDHTDHAHLLPGGEVPRKLTSIA